MQSALLLDLFYSHGNIVQYILTVGLYERVLEWFIGVYSALAVCLGDSNFRVYTPSFRKFSRFYYIQVYNDNGVLGVYFGVDKPSWGCLEGWVPLQNVFSFEKEELICFIMDLWLFVNIGGRQ